MSESDFKVQWSVSLPPAAQYAKGHMLNVRGQTVAEVESQLDSILNGEFIEKATEAAALLCAAQVVTDGTKGNDAPASSTNNSGSDEIHTCAHGKRTRREGTGARGKWVGYFCPLPKGDPNQCDVEWD